MIDELPGLFRCSLPYFGSIAVWSQAIQAGGFAFRQNEHYQRRTERSRTQIASSQGVQTLSLALQAGKHEQCPMTDVRLSQHDNWPLKHWRSISTAYSSSPFWSEYAEEIETLYRDLPQTLWQFNWRCVSTVAALIAPELVLAKALQWDHAIDALPDAKLSQLEFPVYMQVFSDRLGYLPNLSILDLLFCQGPAASEYLHRVTSQD